MAGKRGRQETNTDNPSRAWSRRRCRSMVGDQQVYGTMAIWKKCIRVHTDEHSSAPKGVASTAGFLQMDLGFHYIFP